MKNIEITSRDQQEIARLREENEKLKIELREQPEHLDTKPLPEPKRTL